MFFEDWASPGKELQKFIAFNNTGGRCWDKMSKTERQSALVLWRQQPEQPKHLGGFLDTWRKIYNGLLSLDAPYEIRMDALADEVKWTAKNDNLLIHCSERLAKFIDRNMDTFKPHIVQFQRSRRYGDKLYYQFTSRCSP